MAPMEFVSTSNGWMLWVLAQTDSGLVGIKIFRGVDAAVFARLHKFFRQIAEGKRATITIKQQGPAGSRVSLAIVPAVFTKDTSEHDAYLRISQVLPNGAKLSVQRFPVSGGQFVVDYCNAFELMLQHNMYGDWLEHMYSDAFAELSSAVHAKYPEKYPHGSAGHDHGHPHGHEHPHDHGHPHDHEHPHTH